MIGPFFGAEVPEINNNQLELPDGLEAINMAGSTSSKEKLSQELKAMILISPLRPTDLIGIRREVYTENARV